MLEDNLALHGKVEGMYNLLPRNSSEYIFLEKLV